MTTTSIESLSRRIEEVVQEHFVASRQAAEAALGRAFAVVSKASKGPVRIAGWSRPPDKSASRRGPEALAALGVQLYEAVLTRPGETMTVLAAEMGSTARELQFPMRQLRQRGQVRSVGQRHLTRYFPMADRPAAEDRPVGARHGTAS